MTTVAAGQHGDLAQAHADMGVEGLLRHLAEAPELGGHGRPVDRRLGAAWAQRVHAWMHGEGQWGA